VGRGGSKLVMLVEVDGRCVSGRMDSGWVEIVGVGYVSRGGLANIVAIVAGCVGW
jgi:hypothetical protein